MLKQDGAWFALDVHWCTRPNSAMYGLLSPCKGGQLRWEEPSPSSFTPSSSENSPEFRTILYDSTGNHHEREKHCQGVCFENQGDNQANKYHWKDDINVLLSLVKILFESNYFSCLISIYPSIHPSFFYFSWRSKWNTLHNDWQGKQCSPSGVQKTGILDSLKLTRNVWCVKEVIENKYYTYLKLQTTSHC